MGVGVGRAFMTVISVCRSALHQRRGPHPYPRPEPPDIARASWGSSTNQTESRILQPRAKSPLVSLASQKGPRIPGSLYFEIFTCSKIHRTLRITFTLL